MKKLALLGGNKVIERLFKRYNPLGSEESIAVGEVMKTGVLSSFLGEWDKDFYGGKKVKEFEKECKEFFDVEHAITVNSWTSGLVAAVGAIGIEPGDEVIVSPWTMSASATAILQWNAIPVFADIEDVTFNLDPKSIEKNITPFTKAIMAIDIFGHSADMELINSIAKKNNLKVISDTAQAIGAHYKGRKAGTLADIGGYSLNYHKHIHTGEGGILVTDDSDYAERLRLIRNHAEAVVGPKGETNLINMIGQNFRLGEIESAIGIEQLKKLPMLIESRIYTAERLAKGLEGLKGLRLPSTMPDCSNVYYVFAMVLDSKQLGVSRSRIAEALKAEGVPNISTKYANIHLLPMYQEKIAYGSKGFPWTSDFCKREVSYQKGICPVAEKLQDETYLGFSICQFDLTDEDIDLMIEAFRKVWKNLELLKD